MRASLVAERLGMRSVNIVGRGFGGMAKAIAKALGGRELAQAEYPGVILTDAADTFREKVSSVVADQVVAGLCGANGATEGAGLASAEAFDPKAIVLRGSLSQVHEHFYQKLWTDGLPIIPPTLAQIERFLRFTDRSPDEVIGVLKPEEREATVWSVAVNGVMAGCRPEYMPVLLGIVDAISEPRFRVEDAGSTPGWEPLVIVSGPIVKDLDFNSGPGAMRIGRQANSSIGRFLRLYFRNVAGLRIPPGNTDKGTIAYSFNVALAENEEAAEAIGWPTFGNDRGFQPGESAVTVQSVVAISPPIYCGGASPEDLLQTIADAWGKGDLAYWVFTGIWFQQWHPLLVMSPSIAEAIARAGWSKDDVRRYLAENSRVAKTLAQRYAPLAGPTDFHIDRLIAEGAVEEAPDGTISSIMKPENLGIVVAGDPARNQVRGYMGNHVQGPPTSKRVVLPANWQELLKQTGP